MPLPLVSFANDFALEIAEFIRPESPVMARIRVICPNIKRPAQIIAKKMI